MNDEPEQIDSALKLLTSKERRKVIEYLEGNGTDAVSVEELSVRLARMRDESDGTDGSTASLARTELHHVHLPKLEEYGVVEYDSRTGHVRYHPDEQVEDIVAFLADE